MSRRHVALLTVAGLLLGVSGCSTVQPAQVGECVSIGDIADGTEVDGLETVECAEDHNGQVVYTFDLPEGDFPSADQILTTVQEECTEGFEEYVGVAFEESTLGLNWLTPTEQGWGQGDRTIQCVAFLDDETTTTSFEGSEI